MKPTPLPPRPCTIAGCDADAKFKDDCGNDLCVSHWRAWHREQGFLMATGGRRRSERVGRTVADHCEDDE